MRWQAAGPRRCWPSCFASRAFTEFAQVLADPAIDAVVIATPNDTHAAIAEAALLAGKHVVVDKPFTLTLAQARRLGKLAEECGRVLSVFHNRRWDSDFPGSSEVLGLGSSAARPMSSRASTAFVPPCVSAGARRPNRAGGGSIWGRIWSTRPCSCSACRCAWAAASPTCAMLPRRTTGSRSCSTTVVCRSRSRPRCWSPAASRLAHGTRGSWIKHGLDAQEDQLRAGMVPGEAGWGVDPQAAVLFSQETGVAGQPWAVPAGDYLRYYAGVRDAMLGRGANPVTPAQAIATMAVLETGVEAARCGRWLELPLVDSERQAFGGALCRARRTLKKQYRLPKPKVPAPCTRSSSCATANRPGTRKPLHRLDRCRLTEHGVGEAVAAGKLLASEGFAFDLAYTSVLKRANKTLNCGCRCASRSLACTMISTPP